MSGDRDFPPALHALAGLDLDPGEYDYEPYPEFTSAGETTDRLRSWTGNDELDGAPYRVFAQDGTGGLAALWLTRPGAPLDGQPVVFLGSEGAVGVVARDLGDFLWLMADGVGPMEAVEFGATGSAPNAELRAVAEEFAPGRERTAAAVLAAARAEFPDFAEEFLASCRH
ncbi:SMI1/KNR4 family protein [Saccharothrix yanglingensis]|uniref:SMI1/KNR4 family protein n=1 Tax=Saccharothrix yanglingensis TaxID=659496 RepID=A0ABU0WW78_9PSEU|nr:SMI1/KNR4 family protein [Saccharothrix yanglingensis]MDQ2584076.1 SMI1/KNR4 family protein [Saccharothrix yanglingensis]